ncbi:hypothetical protein ACFOPX_06655 [Helicobacter baculiformis]|uniref:Uncharacterized protein n=1 Tax=Helicobacter baculiformis TaxID=427351 RepID=A0ABV7ZJ57_9HELI|nr:hypothetical protein [Helicobacter baculiformis]
MFVRYAFVLLLVLMCLEAKDFVIQCQKCIITANFSDAEIAQTKKEMGEEAFYVMADDVSYDNYVTRNYAEANHIPYIVVDKDYNYLVTPQQRVKMENKWGYWLYARGKPIKFFSDLSDEDINAYFAIKHPKTPQ